MEADYIDKAWITQFALKLNALIYTDQEMKQSQSTFRTKVTT